MFRVVIVNAVVIAASRREGIVADSSDRNPVVRVTRNDFLSICAGNCLLCQGNGFSVHGKAFLKRHGSAVGRGGDAYGVLAFGRPAQSNCAAPTVFTVTDSRTGFSGRPDYAAVDGNLAARAIITAADSSAAAMPGRRRDCAAVNGNHAARAIITAADSSAVNAAGRRNCAAVDGNYAASSATVAASNGSAVISIRVDDAAVDGNRAAVSFPAAADSSAEGRAVCVDDAAVNGNRAARAVFAAADSSLILAACRGEFAHIVARGLGVDGQAGAVADVNASVDGQVRAVRKNQVYVA